ncbi:hypothetical protein COV20_01520 [Candidatus Woesearchaeota archaeon CG10_big_fil_rev_8_21_14_0_10_45_16]|nr:MAG: hypothetical protein COV20_01520 [Candidatus Woesearchaeota archaeon CG10_big_fil_rev_8_21_14_0_10_45_16]
MAKEKIAQAPKQAVHHSSFPVFWMVYAVIIIAVGVVNYLSIFALPSYVLDGLLILSGLKMLHWSLAKGFGEQRKELLKKYI